MTATALIETQRISRDMLDAAIREDFAQLVQLQSQRDKLIATIAPSVLRLREHQEILRQILALNLETTQRVKDRRHDIGLLLQAFPNRVAGID